ncbi:hypothetical protein C7447_10257 [Tenacibaculum adriaticum]|uniref:Uncharacterized protein n=1 Tax=Tenacibaculum adriaticum TaxID=413713 RepID=A0A5S5DVE1_9FLAO|nr:hypothetical protein [Tenacibaculum adriaticum]TYP98742.1 hypothetical protein C7447_10257 [Tenacibaculum adriaticum]
MKRVVFIAICIVGLLGFTSCGSTSPCGLSQKAKQTQQNHQSEIIVAEAIIE